jgi:hypothetical protein
MKHFFSVLLPLQILAFACADTRAQAPALAGFVFANAIGINGKTDVTANGKKLTRSGLEPAMATSGLGLPVGNYQLQVTAPGCETANLPVTIAVGTTPIVVAYLERKFDARTNTTKNFIRLLQFPAEPQENKYIIKVMAVDAAANFSVTAGGQTQTLQNFKPAVLEAKSVRIRDSAGATEEAQITEKGSYYCFVFRKADGKPGTAVFPQRIYQW